MLSESLFCPIRKEWVSALPEERVRQRVLNQMIAELGFPASLIVVEKALKQLPHLAVSDRYQIPDRRADLICFTKGMICDHSLYPLLIVECKSVRLTSRVINQVLGYNHFVRSCFIAIVNHMEVKTGWYDPASNSYEFINYLPSYETLLHAVQTSLR
jgi:hypothetical protein